MRVFPLLLLFLALPASAQTLVQDAVTFEKAQVIEVLSQEEREIPGTSTFATYQTLKVRLLEGPAAGKELEIENDYLTLSKGETFYLRHTVDATSGLERYAVSEPYRIPALLGLLALFLLVLFAFGGRQGARGLLALIASFFCIIYLLLPGIMAGYSPVLVAMGVASLVVIAGSYITHGFNRTTSAAVLGMLGTIALTGALSYGSILWTRLSGYVGDETTFLHFSTHGSIDFVGLLLASLLIGLLGVLYDAAISQAIAVEELARAAAHYGRQELFARGLRIGREHIGALVNTLAIAYAGAALPLLLLLTTIESQSPLITINQELFATEIVRILVGSIGIMLAVPVTTLIAVYMLHGKVKALRHGDEGHGHRH